jgi:hypothetical protein
MAEVTAGLRAAGVGCRGRPARRRRGVRGDSRRAATSAFVPSGRRPRGAPDLVARRARFYLCAGEAMMAEVTAGLRAAGVPPFGPARRRRGVRGDSRRAATSAFVPSGRRPRGGARGSRRVRRSRRRAVPHLSGGPADRPRPRCVSQTARTRSGCRGRPARRRRGVRGDSRRAATSAFVPSGRRLACDDLGEGQCLTCQAVPLTDLVLDA